MCTGADNAYLEKREGYESSNDIGICLTCILSFDDCSGKEGVDIAVEGSTLSINSGDLAILKPRQITSYSLVMRPAKSMALIFWVSGPRDLKKCVF